jgi:hypothetical protein
MAIAFFAACSLCDPVSAADEKINAQAVDPTMPLAEIMKNSPNDCHIIYQDGKPYKVCPFRVPLAVQGAIKEQMAK